MGDGIVKPTPPPLLQSGNTLSPAAADVPLSLSPSPVRRKAGLPGPAAASLCTKGASAGEPISVNRSGPALIGTCRAC